MPKEQLSWLPASLGAVSKRFGTPHYLLTLFYLIGVATILSGISLDDITKAGLGVYLAVNMLPVIACLRLPRMYPVQYAGTPFRLKPGTIRVIVWLSVVIMSAQTFYLMRDLRCELLVRIGAVMAAGMFYVMVVDRSKRIKAEGPCIAPSGE